MCGLIRGFMHVDALHSWDVTPTEAVELQRQLAGQVVTDTPFSACGLIAGADISYCVTSPTVYAGVVVLRLSDLSVVERKSVVAEAPFPYVPGLLSFRETPVLLKVFEQLETTPDVVVCDGQGLAHPRRFGLACHLGLWLDLPCFGCAKSRYVGTYRHPDRDAGSLAWLIDRGEAVGRVVRTCDGVRPVFVSVGHKIDLASAVRLTLASCAGYRIPEPTRQADNFVDALRRGEVSI
jgi:deoxyribonuclease V